MNRIYNKNTSKQRVMERRSAKDQLQQFKGSSASTQNPRFNVPAPSSMEAVSHSPPEDHAFTRWGDKGTFADPGDGGTTAAPSMLSSWSMGLVEDFNDVALDYLEMMGQEVRLMLSSFLPFDRVSRRVLEDAALSLPLEGTKGLNRCLLYRVKG